MFDQYYSKTYYGALAYEINELKHAVFKWKCACQRVGVVAYRQDYARVVDRLLDNVRAVEPDLANRIEERNAELLKKIREDIPARYFQDESTES